jgi:hypothetical protein
LVGSSPGTYALIMAHLGMVWNQTCVQIYQIQLFWTSRHDQVIENF